MFADIACFEFTGLIPEAVKKGGSQLETRPHHDIEHTMNKWPHTIPQDLAKALENLDGMRFNASDADR